MTTRRTAAAHVDSQVDDYLAGRLDSEAEVAFESHLLACDRCFPAYLIRTIDAL